MTRQLTDKYAFADAVTDIIAENIEDRTERIAAITALTDAYVDSTGDRPDAAELGRLTDYILREELTDANPYKVAHTEYPFLSERQLDLRRDREVPLKIAEEAGADGRNYRLPTRRKRSRHDNWYVDKNARSRNRERAARYKRDTMPGTVVSYNLRDTGGELTQPFVAAAEQSARWRDTLSLVR